MTFCPALRVALVAIAAVVGVGLEARASSCVVPPPCQAFRESAVVFVGRVQAIEDPPAGQSTIKRRVRFVVRETFRGMRTSAIEVDDTNGFGEAVQGYHFEVGRSYLVYAARWEGVSPLTFGACSRTKPLEKAGLELDYVHELASDGRGAATVVGVASDGDGDYPTPLAGVPIVLTCANRSYRTRSDRSGRFHFFRVAADDITCQVRPQISEDRYLADPGTNHLPDEIRIGSQPSCADAELTIKSNGRIHGRVVSADGTPVPDLAVDVWRVPRPLDMEQRPSDSPRTNQNGEFEARHLSSGAYVLGINSRADIRRRVEFGPSTYFQGGRSAATAANVSVAAGERVDLSSSFVVPAGITLLRVSGTATTENGQPAAGAAVRIWAGSWGEDGALQIGDVFADAEGRFSMTLPQGASGWFEVLWPASLASWFEPRESGRADFVVGSTGDFRIILRPIKRE